MQLHEWMFYLHMYILWPEFVCNATLLTGKGLYDYATTISP
jgi:hypothetical protein